MLNPYNDKKTKKNYTKFINLPSHVSHHSEEKLVLLSLFLSTGVVCQTIHNITNIITLFGYIVCRKRARNIKVIILLYASIKINTPLRYTIMYSQAVHTTPLMGNVTCIYVVG